MTLTLELTPDIEARLREEATRRKQSPTDFVRQLVEEGLRPSPARREEKRKAAIALLDSWRAEDAAMTEEEKEEADRQLEAFKANMNANRALTGEEPLY